MFKPFKIKTPAKVNLTLDILGKENGYHLLQTIMQEVPIYDELTFKPRKDSKTVIHCSDKSLPVGATNTIYRAARILAGIYRKRHTFVRTKILVLAKNSQTFPGVTIYLKKNIPIAAGLGGGSSDAAATLIILNKIWNLRLTKSHLARLASKIGMDVPFFIYKGTALATHFGEIITPLPKIPNRYLPATIVVNGKKLSTKEMYRYIDTPSIQKLLGQNKNLTKKLLQALKAKKYNKISQYFHNDFEWLYKAKNTPALTANVNLHTTLLRLGAKSVNTCGSGPAIFADFSHNPRKIPGQIYFLSKK